MSEALSTWRLNRMLARPGLPAIHPPEKRNLLIRPQKKEIVIKDFIKRVS
jgi:hypothetical protein